MDGRRQLDQQIQYDRKMDKQIITRQVSRHKINK